MEAWCSAATRGYKDDLKAIHFTDTARTCTLCVMLKWLRLVAIGKYHTHAQKSKHLYDVLDEMVEQWHEM